MPTFKEILEAEKRNLARIKPDDRETGETFGLAFSGGGIRSATFNLGVLQGLAQAGLLAKAKYLSTVSGGGYIGGWLCSWIKRAPGGMSEVQDKLGNYERHRDVAGDVAEPKQINFLRDYSNYLTPRKGLFGADTWAAIATYFRNVLLNQVILVSFLGAILLIPWFVGAAMHSISEANAVKEHGFLASVVILAAAILLLLWAVGWSSAETARCSLPAKMKSGRPEDPTGHEVEEGASQKRIACLVALPLFLSGSITVLAFWLWPTLAEQPLFRWGIVGALVYFVAHLIGLFVRISVIRAAKQPAHNLTGPQKVGIPLTALFAGIAGGLLVKLCNEAVSDWNSWGSSFGGPMHLRPWRAIAYGPPLLVLAFLLVGCLHIGLLKLLIGPEEQEWWGRLGGLLLLAIIGWAGTFGLAIFAPYLVVLFSPWVKTKIAVVLGWIGSTAFGLLSGKSGQTSGQGDDNPLMSRAAAIAPYIFILGLSILLSLGAYRLAVWPASPEHFWAGADNVSLKWLLPWIVGLSLLAVVMAYRIDVNIFSMNLLYRNRLVRCYLGASRPGGQRRANRFTGFDLADDLFLTDFSNNTGESPRYDGPYPILCSALNVTHGGRLAWQERKAESFVFTPDYCGYEFPEMKFESDKAPRDGFRPTSQYAYPVDASSALHVSKGGVHLGTAISISGAAASPNMGYHTSPPLAFLMTIFDVRLGWWLPNSRYTNDELPGKRPEGGPPCALLYLLNELMAATTDRSKYVYISDGGHFENLAVYELVRRRCRYIVACDADADSGMAFGDLGNAIRKCRSDFGVEITIDPTPVKLPNTGGFARAHGVAGAVRYPYLSEDQPDFVGKILYIKPTITPDTPRDVLAYRDAHPEFPDQSTADQWFDESQFESYRRLGLHSFQSLAGIAGCGALRKPLTIRELFDIVKSQAPS
jgi:hypothetical protein